jgi:AraC-like DNA-binding protein
MPSLQIPPVRLPLLQWQSFLPTLEWVAYGAPPSRMRYSLRNVPHYSADWIQTGSITMNQGSKSVTTAAGEWLFRQPGGVVTYSRSPDNEIISIGFSIRWTGRGSMYLPSKHPFWKTGPLPRLEEKTKLLFQYVKQTLGPNHSMHNLQGQEVDMATCFRYYHLFYDWLATWEEEMRQHGVRWIHTEHLDESVTQAALYLETLPLHQPIRVSEIASNLGISTTQLTRLFQQHFGVAPKAYRMKLKLQHALQQLQGTRAHIKEIAAQLGYSPAQFTTWIKKQTGTPPQQYRSKKWLE